MLRTFTYAILTFASLPVGYFFAVNQTHAQQPISIEARLKEMPIAEVVQQVKRQGDPSRGALVFFKSAAACVKCHSDGAEMASPLGPSLVTIGKETTEQYVAESILYPSKKIKEGYESVRVLTEDGKTVAGLLVKEDDDVIVLRDATDLERESTIGQDEIEQISKSKVSLMPEGLVASLREERDFYDLVRYVVEVARGGKRRADRLRPSPQLLMVRDDTKNLDHAGILGQLNRDDFDRGKEIYFSHCVNCHGADGNTPTLATARAFGTDELKFGADPFRMLVTLTRGNGLMGSMQHLSPKERYQVIHFIRQQFMKGNNPGYLAVDDAYLAKLPKGTDNGEFSMGNDRDYGPVLASQLGNEINHALTFRLPGKVTVNYDLHRFRLGGVWTGGFLDLSQTQHYRQRGERMPQPVGTPIPGLGSYAWELDGTFDLSEEHKPTRGPVHPELATFHGHYLYDQQAVLSYAIAGRDVLETINGVTVAEAPVVQHSFNISPGKNELRLCVGKQMRSGETKVDGSFAYVPNIAGEEYESSQHTNQARFVLPSAEARPLDLGIAGRTIVVRFKTRDGGTLIASAPRQGKWVPNGKTLFVRGKRVVFDIGWVGAITAKRPVTDGKWHTAAVVVEKDETRLYVDGELQAERESFRRQPVKNHVLKIGATATDFGGDFKGSIDWAAIYDHPMTDEELQALSRLDRPRKSRSLWTWTSSDQVAPVEVKETESEGPTFTVAAIVGDTHGLAFSVEDGRLILTIPPHDEPRVFQLNRCSATLSQMDSMARAFGDFAESGLVDPKTMIEGGPTRWPERLSMQGTLGEPVNGYALDTIPVPDDNPWNAWLRTSALDFFEDGRCVVTTHGGDVYLVTGIDDRLEKVTWKRFAAGLFEPFGVRVVDGMIYVTCRDGIKRLHDFDGNEEADFIEAFWIDDDVSSMFHAYNFDLQTDSKGNFYFAKAGQYTKHHRPGTIMKVPPQGGVAEVVAWGLRTPNGMGKLHDDRFTVSDNQGPWMPAGKISLIQPGGFYGNMPINDEQDEWLRAKYDGQLPTEQDEPFIWMPQELDNSCGGQIWASDERWGPLSQRLIHSSYGKGWLYYLSLQEVDGITQSSIVSLPHQWDAGVMRLRINPADGQMYGTGLSGWQGPKGGKDGCLQRLRYTGDPVRMISKTRIVPQGIELTFNFDIDENACESESWSAEMWDYLWSKKYGSDQFSVLTPGEKGRDKLVIASIKVSSDQRTLTLITPDIQVCDQVHLEMDFNDASGDQFREQLYLTIHGIPGDVTK